MKRSFKNIGLLIGMLSMMMVMACEDDIDPVITELETERAFAPINLTAHVRNMVNIELNWTPNENVDHYIVEFSQDSLEFNSIIRTVTVEPEELPLIEEFDSETRYSARVKSVVEGKEESTWNEITVMTALEQIFVTPVPGENVAATTVTLNWTPGLNVTHFFISPGDIEREITEAEKAAGEATIEGLDSETPYTVSIFNNDKRRGTVEFETLVDIGNATAVYPEDDLSAVVAAASEGDVLALFPGDYTVFTGDLEIDKSLTIRSVYPHNKALVHVSFVPTEGVSSVVLRDLEISGDTDGDGAPDHNTVVEFDTQTSFGTLSLIGCYIHDFSRSLVVGDAGITNKVLIQDCLVTDILTDGGDFIDFRGGEHLGDLEIVNTTFINVAPGRDFIRLDDSSADFPGRTSTVVIDQSTFYGVSNTSDRILYVRFQNNDLTVTNSLFAETNAIYSNQGSTSMPYFANNNYFNAAELINGDHGDTGGSSLDPGFVDAENGDLTITNQTLLDRLVGDPRWR